MKELAKRVQQIPPYLFADIERKIDEAKQAGKDIISLGIGDPDLPTPDNICLLYTSRLFHEVASFNINLAGEGYFPFSTPLGSRIVFGQHCFNLPLRVVGDNNF